MNKKIFIVAWTLAEADFWASEWGLKKSDWRYIGEGSSHVLYGTDNPDVRYCGNYMKRTDLLDIQHEVESRTSPGGRDSE